MGRQESVVQLTGSIGNLTFYKTKDGFLARQRGGGISKGRMNSDPKFARTLENLSEFGRANQAAKLLRTALRHLLVKKADRFMSRRLSSAMMEVLHSDPGNDRGSRVVQEGDLGKLKRFEFNQNGKVFSSFYVQFVASIDRATGVFTIDMPAFAPNTMVVRPEGATHFKLKIAATLVDFLNSNYLLNSTESAEIDVRATQQDAMLLTAQLPPALEGPLLLALCIDYFQLVNGKMYSLENGAFNGIAIVEVNQD